MSDCDSDYNSDSLNSDSGRKRRRLSPEQPEFESIMSLPSRLELKKSFKPAAKRWEKICSTPSTIREKNEHDEENPESQSQRQELTTFKLLGVSPALVRALDNMAIKVPTNIQRGCIPQILKGRDCIGGSRTGSGKTIAFAVPILQKLAHDPSAIFALILTPTRELALQILEQFKAIGSRQSLKAIIVTGGLDMREQALQLAQRPHVVIATPGRLADHIRSSGKDTMAGLKRIKFLVLDEADRLLRSGHGSMLPDLDECMSAIPPATERQTLLFTATVTPEVMEIKSRPVRPGKLPVHVCEVNIGDEDQANGDGNDDTKTQVHVRVRLPPTLKQTYLHSPESHKLHYLHEFLQTKHNADKPAIVFVNRIKTADILSRTLHMLSHSITSLHSGLSQRERIDNLGRFRAAAARILVATDVASRGLDIPEVKIIINYNVPHDPDDYIHRVGRTARAGKNGEAVTFFGHENDAKFILAIEERVGEKMEEWKEEGVNIETRVKRNSLMLVSEKKQLAFLHVEEGRDAKGRKRKGKKKLRVQG